MPYFAYRGRNPRGELVQGRLEGSDSAAIADHLLNTGVTPIEIRAAAGGLDAGGFALPEVLRKLTQPPITLVDVMLFSRQLYTLMKAGVPILRALLPFITTVGLFVDAPAEEVRAALAQAPVQLLQFHGAETADAARRASPPSPS